MVSLVVGIALDLLLIPRMGATGAAVATTAAFLSGGTTALVLYQMRDRFAVRALVVPERGDFQLLRALVRPFSRGRGEL